MLPKIMDVILEYLMKNSYSYIVYLQEGSITILISYFTTFKCDIPVVFYNE